MSCQKVRKLLNQYIDETLPIGVEASVREHLDGCPECTGLAQELTRTVSLVQAMPRLETSPEFMANLRRHLPVAVALSRRPSAPAGILQRLVQWWDRALPRRFAVALAPVAILLAVGLYAWQARNGAQEARHPVTQPVISENDYLATLTQEHAGYAREHPLIDPSTANLTLARVKMDD